MAVRVLPLVVRSRDGRAVIPLNLTLIPEYHAREAARFAVLSWATFSALAPRERIRTIAHWIAQRLYEAHSLDATAVAQERERLLREAHRGA